MLETQNTRCRAAGLLTRRDDYAYRVPGLTVVNRGWAATKPAKTVAT
jgi:hypothetical protein